jgi:ABC-2 type transport system ATP-binding protein
VEIVQTRKLTKYYGKARGIVDVDLSIEQGEIFGFIGPNGAGKSTTIRTLLGLIHPTSGSATIFGKDVVTHGPEVREDIGYLPSEVFYYDDMRVRDLLRYSASFYRRDPAALAARTQELADRLDLDLDRKLDQLSYGNKKKVGIVQGLLHSPRLIILDEPTGGLDPLIQQSFFDLLREENERGASVLFSSHILSEVQRLCHRVAIIKDGRIVTVETISTLLENTYKRFHLETAAPIEASAFTSLGGVSDLAVDGTSVSFLFRGRVNDVTATLARLDLTNLLVEEPDLEEVFLHYYRAEDAG